jgi:hypothetical protein
VCAEVGRVFGGGVREEVSVDELGDRVHAAHGVVGVVEVVLKGKGFGGGWSGI